MYTPWEHKTEQPWWRPSLCSWTRQPGLYHNILMMVKSMPKVDSLLEVLLQLLLRNKFSTRHFCNFMPCWYHFKQRLGQVQKLQSVLVQENSSSLLCPSANVFTVSKKGRHIMWFIRDTNWNKLSMPSSAPSSVAHCYQTPRLDTLLFHCETKSFTGFPPKLSKTSHTAHTWNHPRETSVYITKIHR